MKSVSKKVIFALMVLTTIVLLATLSLAKWSFDAGFRDYVTGLEHYRLRFLADDLASYYVDRGYQWDDSLTQVFARLSRVRPPKPPRSIEGPAAERLPPPHERVLDGSRELRPGPPGPGPDGPHRGMRRSGGESAQTALFDSEGMWLAGSRTLNLSDENVTSFPIMLDGQRIGELRSYLRGLNAAALQSTFEQQQLRASIVIALVCLLLAAFASWILSKLFLKPIFEMKEGLTMLASGNYRNKVDDSRKDELGDLLGDINKLGNALEQSRQARRRWIADISHELRTPMTILSGELEAIKDGIRKLDMRSVESLTHETDRLKRLIDDLYELSLSDIGALRYDFQNFDLASTISQIIVALEIKFAERNLAVVLDIPPSLILYGDINRIEQLLLNLLNNAISYTDSGGSVSLKLSHNRDKVDIIIEDSKPGVSPRTLQKMFEPLYREDESRNRRSAGGGLGLAICQNIARAHQGEIHATHSNLGGVKITVTLPNKSVSDKRKNQGRLNG